MGVSLEQTSQTISGISFITAYVAYASTNENQTHLIETELSSFFYPGRPLHVYMRASTLCCFSQSY